MSIESVMPSNHLTLCHPLLCLPSIFPSIRVFSNESALCIMWPKYCSFSFSGSPSNEYIGLIPFRMDWLDLLVVQGTLKSLLQHHSSNTSILQRSAFLMVQLSHSHMTTRRALGLTIWTFIGKVISLLFNMLSRSVIVFLPGSKCFNFMVAVNICSDFGTQENKVCHCFHCFPIYLPWVIGPDARVFIFECWVLSQICHSPLSHSSRGSLASLCFLPLGWCHLHIWGYWYFSQQSWFQFVLHTVFSWYFFMIFQKNHSYMFCPLVKSLTLKYFSLRTYFIMIYPDRLFLYIVLMSGHNFDDYEDLTLFGISSFVMPIFHLSFTSFCHNEN